MVFVVRSNPLVRKAFLVIIFSLEPPYLYIVVGKQAQIVAEAPPSGRFPSGSYLVNPDYGYDAEAQRIVPGFPADLTAEDMESFERVSMFG